MDTDRGFTRWLIAIGALIALAGYFGPWVPHPVAGLVVMGLDLGEYVKFLPAVLDGTIVLWREGFYLPLCAVCLALALTAYRQDLAYGWPLRTLMLAIAAVAALNMLPPAWTPARLVTAEFRLQTAAMGACLAAVLFSPFLALLPARVTGLLLIGLAVPAAWIPTAAFLRILPDIAQIYGRPLRPGWGPVVMLAGLALLGAAGAGLLRTRSAGEARDSSVTKELQP